MTTTHTIERPKTVATCTRCGAERAARAALDGAPILPPGWKERPDGVQCGDCWQRQYRVISVTVPIARPISGDWKDLREALRVTWSATRRVANVILGELYLAEKVRAADDVKLPLMPKTYTYPAACAAVAPDVLGRGSVSAIDQLVRRRYLRSRYDVVWAGKAALPVFKYGFPLPLRAADYSLSRTEDGAIVIGARLAGQRWQLQLSRRAGFRRQLALIERVMSGELEAGGASLGRKRTGSMANATDQARPEGGANRVGYALMLAVSVWVPKDRIEKPTGVLAIATRDDCLVSIVNQDGREWKLHRAHVRRWIAQHDRRIQGLSDDRKAEYRMPRWRSLLLQGVTDKVTRKFADRISTELHQIAALIAGFCRRQRPKTVTWDDTARGYVPHLPYYILRERVAQQVDALGLTFERLNHETEDDESESDVIDDASVAKD